MQSITIKDVPQFLEMVRLVIRQEIENIKQHREAKKDADLISRKEAAKILEINLSTLHIWTEDGALFKTKRGRRVYYRRSDNPLLQNRLEPKILNV